MYYIFLFEMKGAEVQTERKCRATRDAAAIKRNRERTE
jgi:hypothetical protein